MLYIQVCILMKAHKHTKLQSINDAKVKQLTENILSES